jgi:hypothetical protein
MAHYEYFTFTVNDDPRVGTIENLGDKFEGYWRLNKGTPVADRYPPKLELTLSKNGGDLITDFVDNIHSVVIVSDKAKTILEQAGLKSENVEFLSFALKDKKRKKVPDPYYIANALECIDCFDWDRSVYKTYPNTKEVVFASLRKLHVLEDKIPAAATFFRLGELKPMILIRSDLLEKLKVAGCTGISVLPMGASIL